MTALTRLWGRAPLWRGALLLGVAATVLTVLYPHVGEPPPVPAAHYASAPAAMPPPARQPPGPDLGGPAFGSVLSGVAPFAGEAVPLPAGEWVTVAALGGRRPNGQLSTAAMLAQIAGGRVTAVIMLGGVGLASDAGTGFPPFPGCQETRNVYNRVFVDRDGGEHACWSVDAIAVPWASPGDRLRESAAAELRQRGATLPEVTVRTRFLRANRSHLLRYDLYQAVDVPPDGPGGWDWSHIMATPERLARMTRQRDWATSWWTLVEHGFANQLGPAEVTPPLARLPS